MKGLSVDPFLGGLRKTLREDRGLAEQPGSNGQTWVEGSIRHSSNSHIFIDAFPDTRYDFCHDRPTIPIPTSDQADDATTVNLAAWSGWTTRPPRVTSVGLSKCRGNFYNGRSNKHRLTQTIPLVCFFPVLFLKLYACRGACGQRGARWISRGGIRLIHGKPPGSSAGVGRRIVHTRHGPRLRGGSSNPPWALQPVTER